MGKTTLLVVPNTSKYDPNNTFCHYVLLHPQFFIEHKRTLFGHTCSSIAWANSDLQYPNRKTFLNEIFGEGCWEFKNYIIDEEKFEEDIRAFDKENPRIDCQKIVDLFESFKTRELHL